MHRVNGYRHVVGAEQRLQRDQDLLRQTLLDLRTLGEELHDAVDFRQADHRIFRDIGYRRFTIDGNEMVVSQVLVRVISRTVTISSTFILFSMTVIFGKRE